MSGNQSNITEKTIDIVVICPHCNNHVLIEQLNSNIKNSDFDDKPYDSVGLCLYKFKK